MASLGEATIPEFLEEIDCEELSHPEAPVKAARGKEKEHAMVDMVSVRMMAADSGLLPMFKKALFSSIVIELERAINDDDLRKLFLHFPMKNTKSRQEWFEAVRFEIAQTKLPVPYTGGTGYGSRTTPLTPISAGVYFDPRVMEAAESRVAEWRAGASATAPAADLE